MDQEGFVFLCVTFVVLYVLFGDRCVAWLKKMGPLCHKRLLTFFVKEQKGPILAKGHTSWWYTGLVYLVRLLVRLPATLGGLLFVYSGLSVFWMPASLVVTLFGPVVSLMGIVWLRGIAITPLSESIMETPVVAEIGYIRGGEFQPYSAKRCW
jgi:hypothetical protein